MSLTWKEFNIRKTLQFDEVRLIPFDKKLTPTIINLYLRKNSYQTGSSNILLFYPENETNNYNILKAKDLNYFLEQGKHTFYIVIDKIVITLEEYKNEFFVKRFMKKLRLTESKHGLKNKFKFILNQ